MISAPGRPRKYLASRVHTLERVALRLLTGSIGAQEKSLETCLLSPDGSLLTFLCNNGFVHLVSNATKQVRRLMLLPVCIVFDQT